VAAAFAAVSPPLVWYSQEGRNYALVLFLAAVAFLALAHLLRGAGTAWLATWWTACALLLGTHYFAIFFVAGLAAVLLLRVRRAPVVAAVATLGVVELLLVPYALAASEHVGFDPIRAIPGSYRVAQVPSQLAWGPVEGASGPWAIAVAVVLLTIAAALAALRSGDAATRRVAAVAGIAAAVSIGAPIALTIVGIDYLTPRYLLPAWVPLAFLWAAPLAVAGRRWIVAAAACVALAAASAYLLATPGVQRQDWRSVARALGPAPPGDRAVVAPRLGVPLRLYMTPDELDHGLAPSSLRRATVTEIAVIGTEGDHRRGCWWGGACQLPARLLPRLDPPAPGFRLVGRRAVGRFRVALFRTPTRRTVHIEQDRLYSGGRDRMGLFSFVQHP
jgi:4-amino-4-deoxy-L-arabinose transferase-like glycosyltransferase